MTGCLYTTHHFNSGRLLEPGHHSLALGAGISRTPAYGCLNDMYHWNYKDSLGLHCAEYFQVAGDPSQPGYAVISEPKVSWTYSPNASLGYRLGVHGRLGPFTGMELGLHLESPTNPVSGEFDLKLGLPIPAGKPYHHSLSAGWGTGIWADNSYFLEYAASRSWGNPWGENDLFVNYRATYLASQFADLNGSLEDRHFHVRRRLIHQSSMGFKWTLPDYRVLPDFIVPEIGLTYPLAPVGNDKIPAYVFNDRAWDLNLGMGWHFR